MGKTSFHIKKICVFALCLIASGIAFAKSSVFTVKQGNPLILLQEKKTATFELDYSNMIVTDNKDHDNDLPFYEWMISRDEDDDKWIEDWEREDSAKCNKEFRENFNDEMDNAIKLTKLGKDYHLILRFSMIDFGAPVKYGLKGFTGGEALADGEIEVQDKKTNEVLLVIGFHQLKGEDSFKQIGRLIGLFENLGEQLNDYLKDYKKAAKKQKK